MNDKNQSLLAIVKKLHGMIDSADLEKHRHSQDHVGVILGNNKELTFTEIMIGEMKAEWIRPVQQHADKNVILYCHGGGYATGSALYARTVTTKLAIAASMDILCFDYRLAPEHPYPAAIEDAMQAWNYVMMLGYGASNVILAGDSAGGNLALVLALTLKKQKRKLPGAMVLLSPWTDLTASGKTYLTRAEVDPVLDMSYIQDMIQKYAGNEENKENPMLSPLFGDFTGFPSVYIQAGDQEILLSDSTMLQKKLMKDGVAVTLDIFTGMWHVFQMTPLKRANDAIEKCAAFIFQSI